MKKYIGTLLIISFPVLVIAGAPDWVDNFGKTDRYPKEIYLTGFGVAALTQDNNKTKCMNISVQNAQKELINKIYLTVKSHTKMRTEEGKGQYSQIYSSVTQSASQVQLWGSEVEKFYDKKSRTAYALVYVKRQKIIDHYNLIKKRLQNDISHYYNLGKRAQQQGNESLALKYYLHCYPLFNKLFRAWGIIHASSSNMIHTFAELEDSEIENDYVKISELNRMVRKLRQQPIKNIKDVTLFMYNCFQDQLKNTTGRLIILPFTFQNTGMSSNFASFLHHNLKSNISCLPGFSMRGSSSLENINSDIYLTDFKTADSLFFLKGTYWQQRDSIEIMAEICNQQDEIAASMNIMIPQSMVNKTGHEITPENFSQALKEQKIFSQGEINNGGIFLDAWTNKGRSGVVFYDDEIMNIFLRVNIPCYIRLMYHLANGVRTVLLDNYFIDRSYVNTAYKIPDKFVCDQPYGVEVLQIFAQTKPFKKIDTELVDGYKILKEDLHTFLSKTRGMKRIEYSEVLKTEERIVITTMEK
ncbi:MAG: LPP20 family lipoprotein [bacterium]